MAALPGATSADWVNLSGAETAPNIAEVTVFDDRVEVALEIYVGNLKVFKELIPDSRLSGSEVQRPPLQQRLARFSEHGLAITSDSGERLQAHLRLAEPRLRTDRYSPFAGMVNPYTRQRVPQAPADKRVLYVELVYPFGDSSPKTLTLTPPLDEQGRPRVTIGFIAYHDTVPVIDFRFLTGPSTLTLDADPWYSRFDNPNLKRHHKDALMSFLYIEPYEVRHELLVRVRDMAQWMDLELRGDHYIEPDELLVLKRRIGEFLLTKNPVSIDGINVRPILDRSNYVKVGLTGLQVLEAPARLSINSAIIGVIISYITDGLPQQVEVDWQLFTDQIQRVPATAIDPAGPMATFLAPDDPVHRWTNFLKKYQLPTVQPIAVRDTVSELRIPLISLACLIGLLLASLWILLRARRGQTLRLPLTTGATLLAAAVAAWPLAQMAVTRPALLAGELDDQRAAALLKALLKNTYRAFNFRNEEDVYDKLALSVSGDLLTDIYLQNRRSFSIQQAGGAQARVQSVDIQNAVAERLEDRPLAYAIKGNWTAQGTVGHWGHIHTRRNRYDAVVTVEAIDGAWKITDLEVLEEQRVDPAVGSMSPKALGQDAPQDAR